MANKRAAMPVPPDPLGLGQPVVISSQHPLYAGVSAVIVQRPSPEAAIVELSSGERERILLRYLSLPCQHQLVTVWTTGNTLQERCCLCGQIQSPSTDSLQAALKSCIAAKDKSAAASEAFQQRQSQIEWLQGQLRDSNSTNGQNPDLLVVPEEGEQVKDSTVSVNKEPNSKDAVGFEDNPKLATAPVPTEVVEELTPEEERDLHYLERKVERAFVEAGKALQEIHERRLYRGSHKTFKAYCKDRFGFARRHPYRLIEAAEVFENLCPNGTHTEDFDQICPNGRQTEVKKMCPIGTQILPTSERQVRDLIGLKPEQQRSVWQQAVDAARGKVPSSRIVKGIVERLKQKPLVAATQFCSVGDVFVLERLESKEKKYNGCSCVAVEVKDFTVVVDVHNATLTVKPENLNKIDSPDVRRQLPQILQRIRRVREVPGFRDRAAYMMLEHLGRQTYLTPLEDKILQVIEQEYDLKGVN